MRCILLPSVNGYVLTSRSASNSRAFKVTTFSGISIINRPSLCFYQLWDAVEGSLRCCNEDGVSGITALAFLNNRCISQTQAQLHQFHPRLLKTRSPANCDVMRCRIVAARLNGSLDFFTVEINKPLGLLQYRGGLEKSVSELDNHCIQIFHS